MTTGTETTAARRYGAGAPAAPPAGGRNPHRAQDLQWLRTRELGDLGAGASGGDPRIPDRCLRAVAQRRWRSTVVRRRDRQAVRAGVCAYDADLRTARATWASPGCSPAGARRSPRGRGAVASFCSALAAAQAVRRLGQYNLATFGSVLRRALRRGRRASPGHRYAGEAAARTSSCSPCGGTGGCRRSGPAPPRGRRHRRRPDGWEGGTTRRSPWGWRRERGAAGGRRRRGERGGVGRPVMSPDDLLVADLGLDSLHLYRRPSPSAKWPRRRAPEHVRRRSPCATPPRWRAPVGDRRPRPGGRLSRTTRGRPARSWPQRRHVVVSAPAGSLPPGAGRPPPTIRTTQPHVGGASFSGGPPSCLVALGLVGRAPEQSGPRRSPDRRSRPRWWRSAARQDAARYRAIGDRDPAPEVRQFTAQVLNPAPWSPPGS